MRIKLQTLNTRINNNDSENCLLRERPINST